MLPIRFTCHPVKDITDHCHGIYGIGSIGYSFSPIYVKSDTGYRKRIQNGVLDIATIDEYHFSDPVFLQ